MTCDELILLIDKHPYSEKNWCCCEPREGDDVVFTLKADLNARIIDDANFDWSWAKVFPNPKVRRSYVELYYGSSLVEQFWLVSVDGARMTIPAPGVGNSATREEYIVSKAIGRFGRIDDYMRAAGIVVREDSSKSDDEEEDE